MVNKIRLSDYVIQFFQDKQVKTAFQVTGGGSMYLNDSVCRSTIEPVFCHHEQAAAMAATAYSKLNNEVPLVLTTSGCGSTNAITGLVDAWQDGNSVIFISGQCNVNDIPKYMVRKKGLQAVDIIDIVNSITKYSITVKDPLKIKYILEKSWYECTNGYRGPVWIDIPLDIQQCMIDENMLISWGGVEKFKTENSELFTTTIENLLAQSKRPIILAGNGIRLSNTENEFKQFIEHYNIPTVFTFMGTDLIEDSHPLNIGRVGLKGTRAGNFSISNSDLIIVVGASLNIGSTGFQTHLFGRHAKKIVVDINRDYKYATDVNIDHTFITDLGDFFKETKGEYQTDNEWVQKCQHWKNKWSVYDRPDIHSLNMYSFTKKLSEKTSYNTHITVTDAGSANYLMCQAMTNTRLIIPASQGEMGFCIPGIVGSYFADKTKTIIGVTGDGSIQFNIQELQTIRHNKIPAKIFVFNNNGYLSIRNTQDKFFDSRHFGINSKSGISFPSLLDIANTYGFKYEIIYDIEKADLVINNAMEYDGAVLIEVICPEIEQIYPTTATQISNEGTMVSQPLENMYPFLSDEEYQTEMIIPIYKN